MRAVILAVGLAAAMPALAQTATGEAVAESTIGSDRFAAGSSVEVSEPVAGDAVLTGGEVTVEAPVAGGVVAAAGHIDIQAPVAKSLYAVGGSVTVSSTVRHDAWLLADTIDITPAAKIVGAASFAGRTVTLAGTVEGPVQIAARDVAINGLITGDVEVSARRVEIGPQALIGGRVRYHGNTAPQVAPGAQIGGGLEKLSTRAAHFGWHDRARRATSEAGHGLWFGGSFMIGILMLLIGPAFMSDTSGIARREWAQSLGLGFLVLVMVPVVVLMLFITLIGIPVGLVAIAVYAAVLMLGYVCGATAVGDLALERLAPTRSALVGWRILALLGALAALAILRHVPLVGSLAVFAVFLGGVGALTQRAFRTARPASGAGANPVPGAG
ncbi:MAG TPA: polymer-forming cytoskeletal protein [Steroidobacteraceae bacterium]|nr:polymer-forming cytoskeletal protein [Steroidobacteraceae bacterium]